MRSMERRDGRMFMYDVELPDGPWHAEGDHENFIAHGLPCIVHRNDVGSWCGYVGVPPGHPWHGRDFGGIDCHVHGGLTYGRSCQGEICHVPAPGESDDVWWLGFDCNHAGDLMLTTLALDKFPGMEGFAKRYAGILPPDMYWTIEMVREETRQLAAQAVLAT